MGVVVLEGHVSDGGLGGSGGNNPPEDPQQCPGCKVLFVWLLS
jgi:hypothetical protein